MLFGEKITFSRSKLQNSRQISILAWPEYLEGIDTRNCDVNAGTDQMIS